MVREKNKVFNGRTVYFLTIERRKHNGKQRDYDERRGYGNN